MNTKIIVPKEVANAIAHYVALADSKHEAFTDILSLGYEAEKSEIILRHFDHDYDELMQALICGYGVAVEKSPEERMREYFTELQSRIYGTFAPRREEAAEAQGVEKTLDILGIKIAGVNAE